MTKQLKQFNYITDTAELTGYTSTWRPLTKEECAKEIVDCISKYQRKKWYEKKRYLLKRAVNYAVRYNFLIDHQDDKKT